MHIPNEPPSDVATGFDHTLLTISVIISNFNYGEFIGAAIDSALALDCQKVEVIVVDDGSTDNSRNVIDSYGNRIMAIYQENAGQREACNRGFMYARGNCIIFLDSDDILDPGVGQALKSVWKPGISKVQFQMKSIDTYGKTLGNVFPQYYTLPTPENIRKWALCSASYPCPPGSGNAYARTFLLSLFPLDNSIDNSTDSYLLSAAPYYGDVVTIPLPLVSYRIHGRNDVAMTQLDPKRFTRDMRTAMKRFTYAQNLAHKLGLSPNPTAWRASSSLVPYRLASLILAPAEHPCPNDTLLLVLLDALIGITRDQGLSVRARAAVAFWSVVTVLVPMPIRRRFISWRFIPTARPSLLVWGLRTARVIR